MTAIRELRYIIRDGGTLRGRTFWDGHRNGYLSGDPNELLCFNMVAGWGPVPEYMANVPVGATAGDTESNFRQLFCGYSNPDIYSAEAEYWYGNMIFYSFAFGTAGGLIDVITRPVQTPQLRRENIAKDGINVLRDGVRAGYLEG